MGSVTSGWYGRRSNRERVDSVCCVDLSSLRRRGLLDAGGCALIDPVELAGTGVHSIEAEVELEGFVGNAYLRIVTGARDDAQHQMIDLVACGQPFGGVRWWFICGSCDRRSRKLYFLVRADDSGLACRRCHNLQYPSRVLSRPARAKHQADRIYRRVGSWSGAGFHRKPKWMRWKTFDDLIDRAEKHHGEWQRTGPDRVLEEASTFIDKVRKRNARLMRRALAT